MAIAILIALPILFGIIIAFLVHGLGEKHSVLRIFLFLMSFLMVIPSLWFGGLSLIHNDPEWVSMQSAVSSMTYYFGVLFGVVVTYWIIYGFYTMVHVAAQKKSDDAEMKY